jgi:hypothetical protein
MNVKRATIVLLLTGSLRASMMPRPTASSGLDDLLYAPPVTTVTPKFAQSGSDLDDHVSQEFPQSNFIVNPQNTLVGLIDPNHPFKLLIWSPPAGDARPDPNYSVISFVSYDGLGSRYDPPRPPTGDGPGSPNNPPKPPNGDGPGSLSDPPRPPNGYGPGSPNDPPKPPNGDGPGSLSDPPKPPNGDGPGSPNDPPKPLNDDGPGSPNDPPTLLNGGGPDPWNPPGSDPPGSDPPAATPEPTAWPIMALALIAIPAVRRWKKQPIRPPV